MITEKTAQPFYRTIPPQEGAAATAQPKISPTTKKTTKTAKAATTVVAAAAAAPAATTERPLLSRRPTRLLSDVEDEGDKAPAAQEKAPAATEEAKKEAGVMPTLKAAGLGAVVIAATTDTIQATGCVMRQTSFHNAYVAGISALNHVSYLTTAGALVGLAPTLYDIATKGSQLEKAAALTAGATAAFFTAGAVFPVVVTAAAAGSLTHVGEKAASAIASTTKQAYEQVDIRVRKSVRAIKGFFHSAQKSASRAFGRSREAREAQVAQLRTSDPAPSTN